MQKLLVLAASAALTLASCGGGEDPPPPPADTCTAISGSVTENGLEIRKPTRDAKGCHEVDKPGATMGEQQCEEKTPDFSCLGQVSPRETPIMVTLRACVETFGIGATSYGLTVTVLNEKKADGTPADPGYDVNGTPGMQADRSTPIGKTVSLEVPVAQCKDQGFVEIANVPTETDLVVRVTHQQIAKGSRNYVDTYQYGVLLRNANIVDANDMPVADPATACAGTPCYVHETVNTIQNATYNTIARAAGVTSVQGERDLYDGMGQGHIAGEVQDCSSADRVQYAVVSLSATARRLTYFNVGLPGEGGLLDDPKPSTTRTMTNADGLYLGLAVDTMPGGVAVTVGAAVTPSICGPDGVCQCIEDKKNPAWSAPDTGEAETKILGTRRVYIFPDSVTIMTFDRGTYTAPR